MFSSAAAVFAGSLIGAVIVKTTALPLWNDAGQRGFELSLRARKATLSNRRRSFAAMSRATISRSTASASITGDFAAIEHASFEWSRLAEIDLVLRIEISLLCFAGGPPLAISAGA